MAAQHIPMDRGNIDIALFAIIMEEYFNYFDHFR